MMGWRAEERWQRRARHAAARRPKGRARARRQSGRGSRIEGSGPGAREMRAADSQHGRWTCRISRKTSREAPPGSSCQRLRKRWLQGQLHEPHTQPTPPARGVPLIGEPAVCERPRLPDKTNQCMCHNRFLRHICIKSRVLFAPLGRGGVPGAANGGAPARGGQPHLQRINCHSRAFATRVIMTVVPGGLAYDPPEDPCMPGVLFFAARLFFVEDGDLPCVVPWSSVVQSGRWLSR